MVVELPLERKVQLKVEGVDDLPLEKIEVSVDLPLERRTIVSRR
jgi:hypothetical protein